MYNFFFKTWNESRRLQPSRHTTFTCVQRASSPPPNSSRPTCQTPYLHRPSYLIYFLSSSSFSLSLFYKGGIIIIIKRKTLAMNCTFFVVALSFFSTTFPVQFIALKMFVENESNHRFLGTLAVGEKLFCVRTKGKKKQ